MQTKGGLECKTIEKWAEDSVDAESKSDNTMKILLLNYKCN